MSALSPEPRRKPCAIPLCPFLRAKDSYVCEAHSRDAKAGRKIVDSVQTVTKKKPKTLRMKLADKYGFLTQCRLAGLPTPLTEYTFHPTRKWRFDYVFRDEQLAVEVEGGVFKEGGSRHSRGAGFRNDVEKYAEATILGYRVLRVLPEHIENGQAIIWCDRILRHLTTKQQLA